MAGVSVGGGSSSGRRELNMEVNMVPMIDLLMVTIAFLLVTAVWSQLARLNASADVKGDPTPTPCAEGECHERALHLSMDDPSQFKLEWRVDGKAVSSRQVPREETVHADKGGNLVTVRFQGLEEAIREEWQTSGEHRAPTDTKLDHLVLHAGDATVYRQIVAAMDAAHGVVRPLTVGGKTAEVPALALTFSSH
jgi:biopolymer transport protein ExbD